MTLGNCVRHPDAQVLSWSNCKPIMAAPGPTQGASWKGELPPTPKILAFLRERSVLPRALFWGLAKDPSWSYQGKDFFVVRYRGMIL